MASYSYITYPQAIAILSARLYDETNQQWTVTELEDLLNESLQTFNAMSGFWRSEMVFNPAAGSWWFDLRTQANSLIPYTTTQYQLIQRIESHLLEPPTPSLWTGSSQFALQDLLTALQRRQDDTLGVTACTYIRSTPGASIGIRTVLPDSVIDIRRVAWLPAPGFGYVNKPLRQSDMFANRAFEPYYTTAAQAPPNTWMQNAEPPPSFDVDLVPPVPGNYDVLTINSGPAWTAGVNSTLNIPDDWTWVFKWGALMDLLSRESNAKDALRAEYCKRRYEEGLALLSGMPTVLALRQNNIPMAVDSVRNGDDFNPGWQGKAPGQPKSAYLAGNLLALSPLPNSSVNYSMTVSVVQNAPIGGTYVQIARDDLASVIDYAQHLAQFKQGGSEFTATIPLYQRFQRKAAQYNSKLKEQGFFSWPQLELSQLQEIESPRYGPGSGPVATTT